MTPRTITTDLTRVLRFGGRACERRDLSGPSYALLSVWPVSR